MKITESVIPIRNNVTATPYLTVTFSSDGGFNEPPPGRDSHSSKKSAKAARVDSNYLSGDRIETDL